MAQDDAFATALEQLSLLTGGDSEILAELVQTWIDSANDRLADLSRGVASDDAHQVYRACHTLKGSALTFGAAEVAELAKSVEALTKGEPRVSEEARDAAAALTAAVQSAQMRLTAHFAEIRKK